jgi:hypothetical protein
MLWMPGLLQELRRVGEILINMGHSVEEYVYRKRPPPDGKLTLLTPRSIPR